MFLPGRRSSFQVFDQCSQSILAHVSDSVLIAFASLHQDTSTSEVDGRQRQVRYLCDTQPATKHEREDSSVSRIPDRLKKVLRLFILKMLRQWFGQP